MRSKKRIISIITALVLLFGITPITVDAANKNKAACNAFADALEDGSIEFNEGNAYVIADMDGDKVKDLLVDKMWELDVYAYKLGKVKRVLKFSPEYENGSTYSPKMKCFLESGAGDYRWVVIYKLKKGKLKKKGTYESDYMVGDKKEYIYRNSKGEIRVISKKKFDKVSSRAKKKNYISKSGLIKKLRNPAGSGLEVSPSLSPEPTVDVYPEDSYEPIVSEAPVVSTEPICTDLPAASSKPMTTDGPLLSSVPITADKVVYSTDSSLIEDFGIRDNHFYINLDTALLRRLSYISGFYSIPYSEEEIQTPIETQIASIDLELDNDYTCTRISVIDPNGKTGEKISYSSFESTIKRMKHYGDEIGVDIYVQDGKIFRLGLCAS